MLSCLVESLGFVDFVDGKALFVDERLELALSNKVGDLPKNVALSFAANTREQICLVASNVSPFYPEMQQSMASHILFRCDIVQRRTVPYGS
jgi:hypothetical protein